MTDYEDRVLRKIRSGISPHEAREQAVLEVWKDEESKEVLFIRKVKEYE